MTSGAEWIARLEARAAELGITATRLSGYSRSELRQIAAAARPLGRTVARIEAAIAACGPAPKRGYEKRPIAATAPRPAQPGAGAARDPCWRCGTRGDVPCQHFGRKS